MKHEEVTDEKGGEGTWGRAAGCRRPVGATATHNGHWRRQIDIWGPQGPPQTDLGRFWTGFQASGTGLKPARVYPTCKPCKPRASCAAGLALASVADPPPDGADFLDPLRGDPLVRP